MRHVRQSLTCHSLSILLAGLLPRLPVEQEMFEDVGLHQQQEGLGGSSQHTQAVRLHRLGGIEDDSRSHPLWSWYDFRSSPADGFQFLTNVENL